MMFKFQPEKIVPNLYLILEVSVYTVVAVIVSYLLKFSGFEMALESYPIFIELFIFVFIIIYLKSLVEVNLANKNF